MFGYKSVVSTGVGFYRGKEKNKSEKSDKKALTLLKYRL